MFFDGSRAVSSPASHMICCPPGENHNEVAGETIRWKTRRWNGEENREGGKRKSAPPEEERSGQGDRWCWMIPGLGERKLGEITERRRKYRGWNDGELSICPWRRTEKTREEDIGFGEKRTICKRERSVDDMEKKEV